MGDSDPVPGLHWWGARGARLLVLKKLLVGGPKGALKIGRVLVNVFRKRLLLLSFSFAETLSLCDIFASSRIKELIDLQEGREHSCDLTFARAFSNLFFVKVQNLFPKSSCILPTKSIKTLQINCYIFCIFFEAWWAVP